MSDFQKSPILSSSDVSKRDENEARCKLLSVATKLFARLGFEGVSTRDISKESGLNLSLISYYFGGKEGLYRQVLADFGEKAKAKFVEVSEPYPADQMTRESFRKEMHELIRGIIQTKLDSPEVDALLTREMLSGMPHARELFENVFRDLSEAIVEKIKKAQEKGIFRKEIHPYVFFIMLVHAMDPFMMASNCNLALMGKCYSYPAESDLYVDEVFKIFFEGHLL